MSRRALRPTPKNVSSNAQRFQIVPVDASCSRRILRASFGRARFPRGLQESDSDVRVTSAELAIAQPGVELLAAARSRGRVLGGEHVEEVLERCDGHGCVRGVDVCRWMFV